MKQSPLIATPALAFALAAALPAPAAAQSAKTNLYIDVATHTAPGLGGGGLMGRMVGNVAKPHYGMARHPGLPGRYLDVALYNPARPGVPASQEIPRDLKLGRQLDLLPPERKRQANDSINDGSLNPAFADGGTYRVRYYWGCSEHARKGQPLEYSVTVRNGKPVQKGRAMKPRFVPDTIDTDRGYVLWPNQASRDRVSSRASLVGNHHVTGDKLPESMRFDIAGAQDFMGDLEPETKGNTEDGLTLHWNGVEGAKAYFAHATVADGDTIVMWSSSEDGYAGPEMLDYLPPSMLKQWSGKRTVMGAGTRECQVPAEVFASGGMPMLQMTAHGSERTLTGSGWNARVRNKSTSMLMLSAGGEAPSKAEPAKNAAKGLLRGLIGR